MSSRPNVLFVFPDQQRGDWTGYSDVPVQTPNLDALLEDGVAFENAVTPSPVCGPARSCLAQGVEFDRTYVKDHHRQDSTTSSPRSTPGASTTPTPPVCPTAPTRTTGSVAGPSSCSGRPPRTGRGSARSTS